MSRAVADTNIYYISAVMFGGLPGSVLDLGLLRAFTLVTSPPLLDELEDKLRVKFGVSAGDAAAIRAKLEDAADVVNPQLMLDVVKDDPDDNRVLECAVGAALTTSSAAIGICSNSRRTRAFRFSPPGNFLRRWRRRAASRDAV